MKKVILLGAAVAAVAGCATVSQMTATGGSRSDGIVRLSFEAGMFDKVAIDERTALDTARRRCSVWGYNDAEAFGGITRQCQAMGSMGCLRWFVTKEYQCTSSARVGSIGVSPMAGEPDSAGPGLSYSGVRKVRAKTPSGYCLDVPADYVGTGSATRPTVTNALPRCTSLSAN